MLLPASRLSRRSSVALLRLSAVCTEYEAGAVLYYALRRSRSFPELTADDFGSLPKAKRQAFISAAHAIVDHVTQDVIRQAVDREITVARICAQGSS